MALDISRNLSQLRADFRSGRNPRAWLPLGQELWRRRELPEALEVVRDGLGRDPASVAGRTLLVRVLIDLGRYDEALKELARAEQHGAMIESSPRLLIERTRCEVFLHMKEEAGADLEILDRLAPMNSQVQVLRAEWRALSASPNNEKAPPAEAPRPAGLVPEQFLPVLKKAVEGLGKVLAVALVDLETRQTFVEGDEVIADGAALYEREVAEACEDLGHGNVHYAMLETTEFLGIVVARRHRLVIVAADPRVNFGRLQHRVLETVAVHLPGGALNENDTSEEDF